MGMKGKDNPSYKHGESHGWLYGRWRTMKRRCTEPSIKGYERYGGRGIKVCDEWFNSYEAFAKWARSNGCSKDLTLDRIDVNGNYEPDNCRWVTQKEQSRNKRNNVRYEHDGKSLTIPEWAELVGIKESALSARIINGWQFEDAITLPVNGKRYRGVRREGHRSTNHKPKQEENNVSTGNILQKGN